MSRKHGPSPNDQRSVAKSPNNPAFWSDHQNRVQQGHPTPPVTAPDPWSP
jgi:hypothetical protein